MARRETSIMLSMNSKVLSSAIEFPIERPAAAAVLAAVILFPITHFKPFLGLKPSEVFFVLALVLVLFNVISKGARSLPSFFAQSAVVFLVACMLSWLVSIISVRTALVESRGLIYDIPFVNLLTVGRFVFGLGIVWTTVQLIRTPDQARMLAKTHAIGGTLAALIGLGLYALSVAGYNLDFPLFRQFGSKTGVWGIRLAGLAYEPGAFGNYFVSVVPITVAFYLSSKQHMGWWLLALTAQGLALTLTFSTGALGCTLLAIALLLIAGSRHVKVSRFGLLILTGIVLLSGIAAIIHWASISYDQVYTIISKVGTESVNIRWATNTYLLQMFLDRPLFGIGIGNFAHVFGLYTQGSTAGFPYIYPADWRANNDYLTILAETGLVGFACFAAFVLSILGEIIRVLRLSSGPDRLLCLGVACAILGLLLQCWVAFTILNPYTWLLIGLLITTKRSLMPDSHHRGVGSADIPCG